MRLEERLKCAESHSGGSAFLWAQWCFDKALVARSLNVINTTFPHYSLHESSHSASIICEIERIIGPNIENLSFVDVWLLLESAYWHDIGMIIPQDEKNEIIKNPNFSLFLDQMEEAATDYADYAKLYKSYINGKSTPFIFDLDKAFTFLLAEYIRRTHPDRSKQFLTNPESIGIKSPDTGLINSRLFSLLGDIIVCHGRPFSSVLDLPFENDGLEVGDIAHPRLVASLLRLGDLLDLDDGRHCPTQLLVIGKLPSLSHAHLEKHRSIISKSITSHSIEIRSRCQTFEAFEAQNDWFGYIEKEIEDQDRHWGNIAPLNYIGKLPTIKNLSCELENSISMGRNSSRLSLDTNRIYEFLTGKSIYENPLASISEVLQNAVDATIDRIWLEYQDEINEQDINSFRNISSQFKINVSVSSKKIANDKVEYLISISDPGKGMSLDDIQSILTIASEKNQNKKLISRYRMPSWMRPSGFFGIGLQSVFSVSDEINIETQSAYDSPYQIQLRATKGKTPSFIVKKNETGKWKFGTTVQFRIIDDAIPDRVSGHSVVMNSLAKFDPLTDKIFTVKKSQIQEQVLEFARFCEFKILFNGIEVDCGQHEFEICDLENGLEYMLDFSQRGLFNEWYFRGRPFKTDSRFHYLNIRGNIISGRADDFLPLSREKIHPAGQKILDDKIMNSIILKRDEILSVVDNKEMASFFYFLKDINVNDLWRNMQISGVTLKELLDLNKILYISPECADVINLSDIDDIDDIGSAHFIGNKDNDVRIIIDAAEKIQYGVTIEKIIKHEINDAHIIGRRNSILIYKIRLVSDRNNSFISNEAIEFLSNKTLNDNRERYWLPCGKNQYPAMSIPSDNKYLWIIPLTPFYKLFNSGIILKSTSRALEDDISNLVKAIKNLKPQESEVKIESELREFYQLFPFSSMHENDLF